MRVEEAVPNPGFARHETFHLRFGWLKKCYDAVKKDERVFQSDDALVRLGVGKNMVRSIRFWGLAAKIIRQKKAPGEESRRGSSEVEVTEIGRMLFDSKGGLDPYLERPETLWLVHWLMYAPPSAIPAWWIIMNDLDGVRVLTGDLPKHVRGKVSMVDGWAVPNESSIKKDSDVFVHTYASKRGKISDMEDYMDCPFRALRMVKSNGARDAEIQFTVGIKPGMSADIVAYICLDFLSRRKIGGKTTSVNSLAVEPGGPGLVLKLDEASLASLLSEAAKIHPNVIGIQEINGIAHISLPKDIKGGAGKILDSIYRKDVPRIKHRTSRLTMRTRR